MTRFRYTLRTDGSSDKAMIPILTWLLRTNGIESPIDAQWSDFGRLPKPPKGLADEIQKTLEQYECDLLFVHRDAERESREHRIQEITNAISRIPHQPVVPVIPIRMQEAWLLFNESAIRQASGNPNGKQPLKIPHISKLENLPDPKEDLHELLREASGRNGRRRKQFNVSTSSYSVSQWIDDFSPLRSLSAFAALEHDIQQVIKIQNWR